MMSRLFVKIACGELFVAFSLRFAFCALCSRKQFKTAGGSLEKIDVEGVETGPSIYDASWAR